MVMSYLRSAYTVDMQFDAAGEIVVPIRWYRCQTGALPFPGRHLYGTSTQQPTGFEPIGPGEVLGPATPWNNGDPPAPFTGQGPPCGPTAWWNDGVPSDAPPLQLGQWDMPTCCGVPTPNIVGITVGAVFIPPVPCPLWYNGGDGGPQDWTSVNPSLGWQIVENTGTVNIGDLYLLTSPHFSQTQLTLTKSGTCADGAATYTVVTNQVFGSATYPWPPVGTVWTCVSYDPTTATAGWTAPGTPPGFVFYYQVFPH